MKLLLILIYSFIFYVNCFASINGLLYLEGQGIVGYSITENKFLFYSMSIFEAMQKNSVGVDSIIKFSSDVKDIATCAIQARIAYSPDYTNNLELQIYNAYIKYKSTIGDFWIGHNRQGFGLSSYYDSHGLLMPSMTMFGVIYDRDWGIGYYSQFEGLDANISLTLGSGMQLYYDKNYFIATRVSTGNIRQDNWNLGFSLGLGEIPQMMGYHIMLSNLNKVFIGGIDWNFLIDNFEFIVDIMGGIYNNSLLLRGLFRLSVNILEESLLKLEIQGFSSLNNNIFQNMIFLGTSSQLTGDISIKTLYIYEIEMMEHKIVGQLYLYTKIL